MTISAGVVHDQYGDDELLVEYYHLTYYPVIVIHTLYSCWIDTDKGAIWGFVAPMLAIIIVRLY